ncbi:MAG: hypothetical protein AAF393_00130 [Pseudomonadota bacterium]
MSDTNIQSWKIYVIPAVIAVIGVLCIGGLLALIGNGIEFLITNDYSGLAWMTLAGSGFITIVGIMLVGAFIYRAMNLHDSKQALGMPQGSVRSLLMFLVFTLLGVFVFFSVDSITEKRVSSEVTLVKSEADGWLKKYGKDVDIVSWVPGKDIIRNEGDEEVRTPTVVVKFVRFRPASDSVTDLIDQIAIAVFSMASSIIGYYFGTRSQVPPFERKDNAGGGSPAKPAPQGEADSPDWSLDEGEIKLTLSDGAYVGEIGFASNELDEGHEFAGAIVPPEDERKKFEAFKVAVARNDKLLSVQIIGPEEPKLDGAELSIYPVDHDDVAIAVTIV